MTLEERRSHIFLLYLETRNGGSIDDVYTAHSAAEGVLYAGSLQAWIRRGIQDVHSRIWDPRHSGAY